jgi:tRNA (guanine-N7-)-methyltransferase
MDNLKKKREFFELNLKPKKKINFRKVYGNDNPVHLEIGSGRGEFLLHKSVQHSEVNFLAIELKEKRIKTVIRQLDLKIHKNVRVVKLFVDEKITDYVPEESFQVIYIIHPDPWSKRKHHKNRIIQHDFIDVLWKILKPGGIIQLSTDHEEYANWIIQHFLERKDFESVYYKGFTRDPEEKHIETFFEKRKRQEGFLPFFMKYRKV